MEYIDITNSNTQLTPNFKMNEFWHTKFPRDIDFSIPKCLVDAQQILRNFYGCGVLITSCIRKNDSFGFHRYLNGTGAIDSIPLVDTVANIDKFRVECLNYQSHVGSKLIEDLRAVGVQGFLMEGGNCIHLDFRKDNNCADVDKYGKYIVCGWKADGTPYGKSVVYYKQK